MHHRLQDLHVFNLLGSGVGHLRMTVAREGTRVQIFCLEWSLRHLVGHHVTQIARLDGPLARFSRPLLMFLPTSLKQLGPTHVFRYAFQ